MNKSSLLLAMLWTATADTFANVGTTTGDNIWDKAAVAFICAVAAGFGGYFLALLRVDAKIDGKIKESNEKLTTNFSGEIARVDDEAGELRSELKDIRSELKEGHKEMVKAFKDLDERMERRAQADGAQWQNLHHSIGSIEGHIKVLQNQAPNRR
jgi:peptidoglycan hydrolase CwlO-like protein